MIKKQVKRSRCRVRAQSKERPRADYWLYYILAASLCILLCYLVYSSAFSPAVMGLKEDTRYQNKSMRELLQR